MGHTPGPWQYEAATKTIRAIPTNYWLASMDSWDGAVDHEANARLIASAPTLAAENARLREALQEILTDVEDSWLTAEGRLADIGMTIRAALAHGEQP